MLVLTRRKEERIIIGENIVIKVLAINRGQVRLGIEAPADVSIKREELRNATKSGTGVTELTGKSA